MAFNVAGARQAGYSDEEINSYLTSKGQTATSPQPQRGGLGKTLIPIGTSILGGLLGIPGGPLGILAGGAAGGAFGAGITGGGPGDIAREAAFGGLGGLFPASRVLKAGRAAKVAAQAGTETAEQVTKKGFLEKVGGAATRKATIAPKSSLDTFSQQQLLQDTVARYPKLRGSGTAKFQKVEEVIDDLGDQVDVLTKQVKTTIPAINLSQRAEQIVQTMDPNDSRNFVRLYNRAWTDTFGKNIPENLTATDINKIRRVFNRQAASAFKSIGRGGVLSAPNQAIVELRELTDDLLTQIVPQNIKRQINALNKDMSVLIKGIPEFQALSEQVARAPVLGIPLPGVARVMQAIEDVGGRALGGIGGKIPPYTGSTLLGQIGTRALLPGVPEAQAAEPIEGQVLDQGGDVGVGQQPRNITDILKLMALLDLGRGGKNISEIIALSNFLSPQPGAATKTQLQQIEGAQTLVDQLENVYTQASQAGELGPYGRGSLSTLTGRVTGGGMAGKALLYDNLREGFTALIARSTGERGVLTDADAERAKKLIPTANTTPEFAARQFAEIRKIFADAQARIGGTEQFNFPFPQGGLPTGGF